jgi:hypothetical protein
MGKSERKNRIVVLHPYGQKGFISDSFYQSIYTGITAQAAKTGQVVEVQSLRPSLVP